MTERIHLPDPQGDSTLVVGRTALSEAEAELDSWWSGRVLFLVTSGPIAKLYEELVVSRTGSAREVHVLRVPDGEAAKNVETALELWKEMLMLGGKRDSRLLTLGGGSVGDLGGFVASCFLRGIEFAQLPTTLLAQVDASVGGKTGVDLPGGKNTVGTFCQPRYVVADTDFLASLPPEEIRAGLCEVIKMAALLDLDLLDRVERDIEALLGNDPAALEPVIAASIRAKARVVEADPKEGDYRRILNFGHTLAHAIEACLGYEGLRHGEAVGHGMLFALRLARARGLEDRFATRLERLIGVMGLPALPQLDRDELLDAMQRDKKAQESGLAWVLPEAPGRGVMVTDVSPDQVSQELDRFLATDT